MALSARPLREPLQPTVQMPSIIFLIRALDLGGAQRQLVELAAGLHGMGWKVHVMTFYGGGALEPDLEKVGVALTCLNKRSRWDVAGFLWRSIKAIRNAQSDIVHGYLDVANILLTVLRPIYPCVRVVWGVRSSNMDLTKYGVLAQCVYRVSVVLSRFADLIICNSEAGRAYCAARGYREERLIVIPNGVDVRAFRPDPRARQEVRQEWGISADSELVGLVARLDPMKDHPNFLRAAAQVLAARSQVRFVCVGTGPAGYLSRLKKDAADLGIAGRMIWAGERQDMWRVYNALDLAVSSSLSEGTSNAIAEAMATGVACVATDVGDSRYLVGELGIVCLPGDSVALAQAILRALADIPTHAAAIRQRMILNFSSEALVTRTVERLRRLIDAGAGGSG